MDANLTLTEALLAGGTIVIFLTVACVGLYRVVVWARRQEKRAYVIGAALAPFIALGNVSDPDFRIVQEAKRQKNREDDDAGDPPEADDERLVLAAADIAAQRNVDAASSEENVPRPGNPIPENHARPVFVWVISVALGLAAVTSLGTAWLLVADSGLLFAQARLAPQSLSAFDWASIFAMSALLLTSMVMLFRLRKSSVHLFAAYLTLGTLASMWYAVTPEHEPYFDPRFNLAGGLPLAIGVLLYMLRLKKRALLA